MLDALLEAVRDMTLAMLWLGTQVVAAGIGSMLTVAGIGTALRRLPVAAAFTGPPRRVWAAAAPGDSAPRADAATTPPDPASPVVRSTFRD